MSRRILVTSNCQTGGVAAALQGIFTEDVVEAMPAAGLPQAEDEARAKIAGYDVWATSERTELLEPGNRTGVTVVHFPAIIFSAFHPDPVYIWNDDKQAWMHPHYNSKIASGLRQRSERG